MSTEYYFLTELQDYYWFPRTEEKLVGILEDSEMGRYEVGFFFVFPLLLFGCLDVSYVLCTKRTQLICLVLSSDLSVVVTMKTYSPFTVLCRSHPKVHRSFVPLNYSNYCNK